MQGINSIIKIQCQQQHYVTLIRRVQRYKLVFVTEHGATQSSYI